MIDFLEAQLVAKNILIQVPTDRVTIIAVKFERFPIMLLAGNIQAQQRFSARMCAAFVNLVDSDVGKQGEFDVTLIKNGGI
jgi:hypothetical protein